MILHHCGASLSIAAHYRHHSLSQHEDPSIYTASVYPPLMNLSCKSNQLLHHVRNADADDDHAAIVLLGQLAIIKTNIMNACLIAFKLYKTLLLSMRDVVQMCFVGFSIQIERAAVTESMKVNVINSS